MQQVIVVHGGTTFENREDFLAYLRERFVDKTNFLARRDWKFHLGDELGETFEVLAPQMPNKTNAAYDEWAMWFVRMLPFVEQNAIFIGHSLGAAFLTRFLSEASPPHSIRALLLVAPPYEGMLSFTPDYNSEEGENGYNQGIKATLIYQSMDDTVVPYSDIEHYRALFPRAVIRTFSDRGHFNGESFPEIVEDIRRFSSRP